MRIVITGHRGQLGAALQTALAGAELFGLDLPEHDISDPLPIRDTIVGFRPDLVIHGAAMTNVDGCEREPEAAYRVNTMGTQNIAIACGQCDAAMVHISTNDVFDGKLGRPYYEWDKPSPQSVYAQSKAAAEFYVRTLLDRFYIVRTSWLYAKGGENFITKIIRAADKHGRLRVVTDEVATPTYAPDLAEAISQLIRTGHFGIYHFANSGSCSRYEWAKRLLELSGRGAIPVEPITADQWQRDAPPPLYAPIPNCVGAALGITLRPWDEALQDYFANDGS
ncbi:MAG: dTDP-4-dehydrorhamnose reductase [Anaerolineae bacterium]|nr:dTDP-4-dehydrorhamnose reductase [Anaerolineae bacterium]